jgi:hypothetical protein
MNFNSILSALGSVSGQLASAIVPGVANAEKLFEAGKSAIEAFKHLKDANGGTAPADAEASHRALVDKVNAHAESTFGRAEGGD